MNDNKLAAVVAEAIEVDRQVTELQTKLKELKEMLILEAESRSEEHEQGDGGGSRWTAKGLDGCTVRVSFPAPTLKASIDAEKPAGAKVMDLVGRHKDDLFSPRLVWVPTENFRARVAGLFDAAKARKIVRSCETQSAPRVAFETREPQPQRA